jgi:hypothetical protein
MALFGYVTLAQTQSTGEPIQRVDGTMVDRIFYRFRNTCGVVTTRACLTSPDSESAPAALRLGARVKRLQAVSDVFLVSSRQDWPSTLE